MNYDKDEPIPNEVRIINAKPVELYNFPNAMYHILNGDCITKLEWQNAEYYAELRNSVLMLHKPEGWFSWIISEADMQGTDWMLHKA